MYMYMSGNQELHIRKTGLRLLQLLLQVCMFVTGNQELPITNTSPAAELCFNLAGNQYPSGSLWQILKTFFMRNHLQLVITYTVS